MNLKSARGGQDFSFIRFIRFGHWPDANESNASKVGTQGQDFRCIRVIILGPLPEANDSNASKVGPKARRFVNAVDA